MVAALRGSELENGSSADLPLSPRSVTTIAQALSPTEQAQRSTLQTLQTLEFNPMQKTLAALPAVALSMFDQFAETFGMVDENDLENYLTKTVPRFGAFFEDNRGAIETTAAIGGLFIPGTLAIKAVRSKGMFARAAVKVLGKRNAGFVTSTGKSNQVLFRKSFQEARLLGIKNTTNLESAGLSSFNKARTRSILKSGNDIFVESIAAEAAIYATMGEFDFLFPDEMSVAHNLGWGFGTSVLFGIGAAGIARSAMVKGVANSFRQGKQASTTVTEEINAAVVGNRAGERGTALTARALFLQEAKSRLDVVKTQGDQDALDLGTVEVTALREQMNELLVKAFSDSPIEGVTKSIPISPVADGSSIIKGALNAIEEEPTLALGLRSLENFSAPKFVIDNDNFLRSLATTDVNITLAASQLNEFSSSVSKQRGGLLNSTGKQVKKLRRMTNKLQDLQDKYALDIRTVPIVLEIDGTISAASTRAAMFQDGSRVVTVAPNKVAFATVNKQDLSAGLDGKIFMTPESKAITISLDETGALVGDNVKPLTEANFLKLDHFERSAIYDVLQRQAERAANNLDAIDPIVLTKKSHFTQIDYAIELIKRTDGEATKKISGFPTLEALEFQSLVGKFKAFQSLSKEAAKQKAKGADAIYAELDNVAVGLNLPKDGHPVTMLLAKSQVLGDDIIPLTDIVKSMDDMKLAVKDLLDIPLETELVTWQTSNNMLNVARDRKQSLAFIANVEDRALLTTQDLKERVFAERAYQAAILENAKDAIMIQAILGVYKANPEATALAKAEVMTVVEGNLSEGAVLKNLMQQSARFREQDAFAAFDLTTDMSSKMSDQIIKRELLEAPFLADGTTISQVFSRMKSKKNTLDLVAFQEAVNAKAAGWELLERNALRPIKGKNGESMAQLMIKGGSVKNQALYKAMFNEAMPEGKMIPMPITGSKTPVTLTQMGVDALNAFDDLSGKLLIEDNTIRLAQGLPPIGKQQYHTPPVAMTGKQLGFLIDKLGKVKTIIPADTERDLAILMTKEIAAAERNGTQLARASEATVKRYYAANSEAFFGTTDFSRTLNQTGAATGKTSRLVAETGVDAFDRLIEAQIRQFTDVARETRALVFAPEISFLKLQRAKTGIGPETQTIYDDLITRILGVSNLTTKDAIGAANEAAESLYDHGLTGIYNQVTKARELLPASDREAKRIQALVDESSLRFPAGHTPFNSMLDFMERTHNVKQPPSLRSHSNLLNEVTTASSLRVMELGLGFINIATLASTLPVVNAALKPLAGESLEVGTQGFIQWQKRVGAFTTTTPKDLTFYSPIKAITDSLHFAFTDEARRIAKIASQRGLLDQFAAERIATFGRTGEGSGAGLVRDLTDKLSIVTDKTEEWSRGISFMHFYNVGRKYIGLTEETAMTFANKQANNVIADFRPTNRPLIFQGAAGMPLGLFTTYMWNFLQRIGGMAETFGTGGGRVAAIQAALQTSLWGGESLPGWQLYTETFMENYDGSSSIVDRLNKSMGSFGADLFLNGTVSNLPRLMGLSDEGISIGPRAGVGLPFPSGINPILSSPGVQLMVRAGQTAGAIFDSTVENQGLDPIHIAEIISAANLNKGMSHLIELGVTNRSLDRKGNVIEPDVTLGLNIATGARVLGFRPLFADELRQENVRNRKTDRVRKELLTRLSSTLRSKARGGRLRQSDTEHALQAYTRAGGNMPNFDTYFKSQLLRGTESKVSAEIAKSLQRSVDSNRYGRLIYLDRD